MLDERYGSRAVLDLQIMEMNGTPIMKMDYANTSSLEMQSSRVYAMGAGTRRVAWDGEKTATLTVETQIFTMEHLALLAGEEITKGAQSIYRTQVATVATGKTITLDRTPVGSVVVYPFVNGVAQKGSPQEVDGVVGKVVTLDVAATAAVGTEVEVYYQHEVTTANKLSFTAKGFPKYVKLAGDTTWTGEVTTEEALAQMVYYKAKLQPNFTITNSSEGDPSTLSLVFDLFPMKVEGVDTLIDLIVYDDQEA